MIQYPTRGQPLFSHIKETAPVHCRVLSAPLQVSFNTSGHTSDVRIGIIASDDASIQTTQDRAPEFVFTFDHITGIIRVTLCILDTRKTNVFLDVVTHLYSLRYDYPLTVEDFFELYENTRKSKQTPPVVYTSPVTLPPTKNTEDAKPAKPAKKTGMLNRLTSKVQRTLSRKKQK